jgi:glycosyltransferase involved in cell wall biosynthesis
MPKKLLYVSNIPQHSQTGGANAVNFHMYQELQKHFHCSYVQINPAYSRLSKLISNINRKFLKRPGSFFFFSNKRLKAIQSAFEASTAPYDLVFFKGITPWILCQPQTPYAAYCDVGFQQFFENTFEYKDFRHSDMQRILSLEKQWLSNAAAVFFESRWGLQQTAKTFEKSHNFKPVGRGGSIPLPAKDVYKGDLNLLVIANDFHQKGGDYSYQAMKTLLPKYPSLKLHVIGGAPPQHIIEDAAVIYLGRLSKEVPAERQKMVELMSQSFLLMHMTREDINPLVPTEVGYFGCPTISIDKFAIPELVQHEETGFLCKSYDIQEISDYLERALSDTKGYQQMRARTFAYNQREFSWEAIGNSVSEHLKTLLE